MNIVQDTSLHAESDKALSPPSCYCFYNESCKRPLKFSREFKRKVPVNSDFTVCKPLYSRENLRVPFMYPVNQQVTESDFSAWLLYDTFICECYTQQ